MIIFSFSPALSKFNLKKVYYCISKWIVRASPVDLKITWFIVVLFLAQWWVFFFFCCPLRMRGGRRPHSWSREGKWLSAVSLTISGSTGLAWVWSQWSVLDPDRSIVMLEVHSRESLLQKTSNQITQRMSTCLSLVLDDIGHCKTINQYTQQYRNNCNP